MTWFFVILHGLPRSFQLFLVILHICPSQESGTPYNRAGQRKFVQHCGMESLPMESFPFALAAIDIDATLLGPDGLIGVENRRAVGLLRDLDCRVMLASGRRHANMLPFCDDLGLDEYVVSCQGARVEHSSSGLVLRRACITPDATVAVVTAGMERGHTVLLWLADSVYAQAETFWVATYLRESGDAPVTIIDLSPLARTPAEKVVWAAAPSEIAGA